MLVREALREAWRNIASGTSRAALFGVTLGVLLAALALADAIAVGRLDAQAQAYRAVGAAIRAASAPKAINAEACEALANVNGVTAAGAFREATPTALTVLGGQTIPSFEITKGLLAVFGANHADEAGVFISTALAERWNIEPGGVVDTDRGPVTIAGVFPYPEKDGRDPRFANAILLPTLAAGRFDACLAEVWPSTSSRDGLLRATADASEGRSGGSAVALLNDSFGRSWKGSEDYAARVTRFAPVAAAIVGLVLGVAFVRRRRLEFAAALHAGVLPGRLAVIVGAESTVWTASAALGAFGAVVGIGVVLFRATLDAALVATAATCAAGALAAVAGALVAASSIRERHLFRHFKNRS